MNIFSEYATTSDLTEDFEPAMIAGFPALRTHEGIFLDIDGDRHGPFENDEQAIEFADLNDLQL